MPLGFLSKCNKSQKHAGSAEIVVYSITFDQSLVDELAPIVQTHYFKDRTIQDVLNKWKRPGLAKYIDEVLPVTLKGKSGHLGEILATEYVNNNGWKYLIPIKRLQWKDGRDCAMRGEDILGFDFDEEPIRFLKGESKSRKSLVPKVVGEARLGLEKNAGLPQAHTLIFIAERLAEMNQDVKANKIREYVADKLPQKAQVAHLMFIFSGNDPFLMLEEDLKGVKKGVEHFSVGLFVKEHQQLIKEVFERVRNV